MAQGTGYLSSSASASPALDQVVQCGAARSALLARCLPRIALANRKQHADRRYVTAVGLRDLHWMGRTDRRAQPAPAAVRQWLHFGTVKILGTHLLPEVVCASTMAFSTCRKTAWSLARRSSRRWLACASALAVAGRRLIRSNSTPSPAISMESTRVPRQAWDDLGRRAQCQAQCPRPRYLPEPAVGPVADLCLGPVLTP